MLLENQPKQPATPVDAKRRVTERFRLPHSVIVRAPGLLPMLYTPRELERELGVPARTIREWLDRGLAASARRTRAHLAGWSRSGGLGEDAERPQARPRLAATKPTALNAVGPSNG